MVMKCFRMMQYHKDPKKQRVATILPTAVYERFCETASMTCVLTFVELTWLPCISHCINFSCSPMFILPVFRGPNSFETFVMQCQMPLVLFTSLEDYKRCAYTGGLGVGGGWWVSVFS